MLKKIVVVVIISFFTVQAQGLEEAKSLFKKFTGKDIELPDFTKKTNLKSLDKNKAEIDTVSSDDESENLIGKLKDSEKELDEETEEELTPFEMYLRGEIIDPYTQELYTYSIDFDAVKVNPNITSSIPDTYLPSVGDVLVVDIWGSVDESLEVEINGDGYIILEKFGKVSISNLNYGEIKQEIMKKLSNIDGAEASVRLSEVTPVQVYVTGQVKKPGVYTVSPFSSMLEVLAVAGGISSSGSYRNVEVKSKNSEKESIDLYSIMFGGKSTFPTLNAGSVIFVPIKSSQVAIAGNVKSSGIFELREGERLQDILQYSGLTPFSEKNSIEIESIDSKGIPSSKTVKLSQNPKLNDGDVVRIFSTLVYNSNFVTLKGSFKHPKNIAFRKGMSLGDVLKERKILKHNSNLNYAHIIRKNRSMGENQIISFSPENVFNKKNDFEIELLRNDTIEVFSLEDVNLLDQVAIDGEVKDPGRYAWSEGIPVNSILSYAGGKTPSGDLKNVTVYRFNSESGYSYFGQVDTKNFPLLPGDSIYVGNVLEYSGYDFISINGEVQRPGKYPWFEGITPADLIAHAEGYTTKSRTDSLDIFTIVDKENIKTTISFDDIKSYELDKLSSVVVKARKTNKLSKLVSVYGEVENPGVYLVNSKDQLNDLIEKAGGITDKANLKGIRLFRKSVKKIQEEKYEKLRRKLRNKLKLLSLTKKEEKDIPETQFSDFNYDSIPATGRVIIPNTGDKFLPIAFENRDSIYIPEKSRSITVMGEVLFESSIVYNSEEREVEYYLDKVGGVTDFANTGSIHVIKANGEIIRDNWCFSSIYGYEVEPGDMIYVPYNYMIEDQLKVTKDISTIFYQLGLATASMINATK
ncbi:MAG: hypothetical protein CR982_04635 [Candidatus Cloacimonadota bacterium]|nr:MAG: hypothetical protein CR982_04635 [Candidatus Cloacimonadota bacterium]PIE77967.1 MAG: hypothetical protein CSA15_10200 [Candidatus Delongbacteria bacterium]